MLKQESNCDENEQLSTLRYGIRAYSLSSVVVMDRCIPCCSRYCALWSVIDMCAGSAIRPV